MPALGESELKKQLDHNDLGNLYLIYGAEKILIKRAVDRIIKKTVTAFPEFNLQEFSDGHSAENIVDSALALPMMAENKCTVVSDLDIDTLQANEKQMFFDLLSSVPSTTRLVLYYPTLDFSVKKSVGWKKIMSLVQSRGYSVEYKPRDSRYLAKLVIKRVESAGCVISKNNLQMLLDFTGSDMRHLLNEVEKLCAYANHAEITRGIIELLVIPKMETTIFLLCDALLRFELEKTYRYLDMLFSMGQEPIMMIGAISATFLDMYRVKAAVQSGLSAKEPAKYSNYKGKEFRLSKAERNARGHSTETIGACLSLLLQTDLALKSSKLSPHTAMEQLLCRLVLVLKGELNLDKN